MGRDIEGSYRRILSKKKYRTSRVTDERALEVFKIALSKVTVFAKYGKGTYQVGIEYGRARVERPAGEGERPRNDFFHPATPVAGDPLDN